MELDFFLLFAIVSVALVVCFFIDLFRRIIVAWYKSKPLSKKEIKQITDATLDDIDWKFWKESETGEVNYFSIDDVRKITDEIKKKRY